MARSIILRFTFARYAWLERLDRERLVSDRPRGCVGFECMKLGLTQWAEGRTDRSILGEALTDHGRQVLAEWRRIFGTSS